MPSKQALAAAPTPESVRSEIATAEKRLKEVTARLGPLAKLDGLEQKIAAKKGEYDHLVSEIRAAQEQAALIISDAEDEAKTLLRGVGKKAELELDVVKEESAKLREKWAAFEEESNRRTRDLDTRATELNQREADLDEKNDEIDAKAVRVRQDREDLRLAQAAYEEKHGELAS